MTRKKQSKTFLILAAVAMAVFTGSAHALEGELGILTTAALSGNNPATSAPWAAGDDPIIPGMEEPCIERDIDGNCIVNFLDLALFFEQWLEVRDPFI